MEPGRGEPWVCHTRHQPHPIYTQCCCCGCCSSRQLCRVSAAQHNEVKDAPGSLGWLEHFLGSLAGVHLAPADAEVMAVVSQHLKADKAVSGQPVPPLWFLLSPGICPFPPAPPQPFSHKAAGRGPFFVRSSDQPAAQPSLCTALLLCCPHCPQHSVSGLESSLCLCCIHIY